MDFRQPSNGKEQATESVDDRGYGGLGLAEAVSPNEANQGRKIDSIRFQDEDRCRDRFRGWSKESPNTAGLRVPTPWRIAFLTKRGHVPASSAA